MIHNEPLLHAIASASISRLTAFGAQGIADMAWSYGVLAIFHEHPFLDALESCVRHLLPRWARGLGDGDLEALLRGLQRLVWGLWRLSRPRAAGAAAAVCLEAGLAPDPQVLSVLLMDSAMERRRCSDGVGEALMLSLLGESARSCQRRSVEAVSEQGHSMKAWASP